MPELIERVDRRIAGLYRGADLSTMSSGSGDGSGASLRGGESLLLEADDCMMISETLADVSRQVIEWHDGKGAEPLAYIEITPRKAIDKKALLKSMASLSDLGCRIRKADAAARLGFSIAADDQPSLGEAPEIRRGR